ncbi:MAG: hypothetical protein WC661_22195 [Opitutaceae bacterium]|jgi:hypothetical protein
MVIAIQLGTGGDALALATLDDTVENLLMDGHSVTQERQLFHAATAEMINRGNRSRQITFTVKRKPLASVVLAVRALAQHELDFETKVGPTFAIAIGSAGAGFKMNFANAVIQHRGRAPGTSSVHDYTVTGGSYTITDL